MTPIQTVHVSQQQAFGRTVMDASDAGVPSLGYVTEYAALVARLRQRCEGLFVDSEPGSSGHYPGLLPTQGDRTGGVAPTTREAFYA